MVYPTSVNASDQIYVQMYPQNEDYDEFSTRLISVQHNFVVKQNPGMQ